MGYLNQINKVKVISIYDTRKRCIYCILKLILLYKKPQRACLNDKRAIDLLKNMNKSSVKGT